MDAENNKQPPISIIAGIIFALLAIMQFVGLPMIGFAFTNLVSCLCYAFLAFLLFTSRRDSLLVATLGVLSLFCFISVFNSGFAALGISGFFSLAAFLLLLMFALITVLNQFKDYAELARQLWFLPGILYAVSAIVRFLFLSIRLNYFFNSSQFPALLLIAGVFLLGLWITGSAQSVQSDADRSTGGTRNTGGYDDGYCDLVKHILLLLFTFGIWQYIWIYRTTRYLNRVPGEEPRDPTSKLLLCMFVPFYHIYWVYKSAQRVDTLASINGIVSDLSTLCLILAIFVQIIPPILIQEKINTISTIRNNPPPAPPPRPSAPTPPPPPPSEPTPPSPSPSEPAAPPPPQQPSAPTPPPAETHSVTLGVADELKKFKNLLDAGIITQEEFDMKKKELLKSR